MFIGHIPDAPTLLIAFLGGLVPSLLWLIFWLLEDRCEPEPKWLIFLCFIGGMAMVPLVLPFERWATVLGGGTYTVIAWAALEEIFKLAAAYVIALRNRALDEPIDAIIYMVTIALGFAALENALFLLGVLQQGGALQSVIVGNLRFIGATLLHTLSSATIGIALALAFFRSRRVRRMYLFCGVILAIVLHAIFNFFILSIGGGIAFFIFLLVWIGVIGVLLFFEGLKRPARDYC